MVKSSKFRDMVGADNEREKNRGSGYGHLMLPKGMQIIKIEGKCKVLFDFLPYVVSDASHPCRNDDKGVAVPGEMWYRRPYKLHRRVGANDESVVCPKSFGKKCPICEYRTQLMEDGKKFDDEEVKALKPSDRNLYAIVPLDSKDHKEEISLFDISRACFQDKLREETDENPEFRAFFDPSEDGYTLEIRFSEEQIGRNKFADCSRIDFLDRRKGEGYDDKFLEDVPNLDKLLILKDYDTIKAMFFEDPDKDDEPRSQHHDKYDDDKSSRKPKGAEEEQPRSRRSRRDEKEEDDEPRSRRSREEEKPKRDKEEDEEPRSRRRSRDDADDKVDDKEVRETVRKRAEKPDDDDPAACKACGGSGENSKGGECSPCKGTGKKKVEEEEKPRRGKEEEKKEEDKPRRSRRNDEEEKPKGKCPHGHKWGDDCDKEDECTDCKKWDECFDAKGK